MPEEENPFNQDMQPYEVGFDIQKHVQVSSPASGDAFR